MKFNAEDGSEWDYTGMDHRNANTLKITRIPAPKKSNTEIALELGRKADEACAYNKVCASFSSWRIILDEVDRRIEENNKDYISREAYCLDRQAEKRDSYEGCRKCNRGS